MRIVGLLATFLLVGQAGVAAAQGFPLGGGNLPSSGGGLPVSANVSEAEANAPSSGTGLAHAANAPKAFVVLPVDRAATQPSETRVPEVTQCKASSLSRDEVHALVLRIAVEEATDAKLAESITREESHFDANVKLSQKGAIGVMQLMPDTARSYGVDACDVEQNVRGGVRFLKHLLSEFGGNVLLVAAAYNAGPERVYAARGVPAIAETVRYVANVTNNYFGFENALAAKASAHGEESIAARGEGPVVSVADSRTDDRWEGSVLFVGDAQEGTER